MPSNSSPLIWVASNADELYKQYPNEWILVDNDAVIAHSKNPLDVAAVAKRRGNKAAFITKAVPPSKAKILYAGEEGGSR